MVQEIKTDVIVIGGGPVGMWASFMCKMVGLEVVLVEALDKLGGQCSQVYPEKPIFDIAGLPKVKAKDLITNLHQQMQQFDIPVFLNATMNMIKHEGRRFIIELDQDVLESESMILATGEGAFRYNKPRLNGINELEAKGYVQYAMTDLEMFRNKVVVVGGGGDSALDWCVTLHGIASRIYLIHRRGELRAMVSLQQEVAHLLNNEDIMLNTDIVAVEEHQSRLLMTCMKGGQGHQVEADYFVPCYGVQGDKSFLDSASINLDHDNRVIVDPATSASSLPGLYAVGDASTYLHKRKLIVCGNGEAANAAYHIRETTKPDFVFEYSTSKFV